MIGHGISRCWIAGLVLCAAILRPVASGADGEKPGAAEDLGPQCAHWCIIRSCELLGVPTGMATIRELLPSKAGGHSMLEMATTLQALGLEAKGMRLGFEDLRQGPFPVIAHFSAGHFVTVSEIRGETVRMYDGSGRMVITTAPRFQGAWDGAVLRVRRPRADISAKARAADRPRLQFATLLIDKGEVPWIGEPLAYEFSFRNTGQAPLVIKEVRTDCSCLGAQKPDQPVAPGQAGVITLRYRLRGGGGAFSYRAVVISNDPEFPVIGLIAAGNTDTRVSVNPAFCSLERIIAGTTGTYTLFVSYSGDEPLVISGTSCSSDRLSVRHALLTKELAQRMWHCPDPGSRLVLNQGHTLAVQVSYASDRQDAGKTIDERVTLSTNIRGFEHIAIPVSGDVVGRVAAYPGVLYCSPVAAEESLNISVVLASLDRVPFTVQSVTVGDVPLEYKVSEGFGPGTVRLALKATGQDLLRQSDSNVQIMVTGGAPPERDTVRLPFYVPHQ